ncbi:MAG: hypothetical protein LBE84_12405 [Planctomycetota bacterium]|jgi:hypothetical protein|nr:hypothetical protein [Planctomycetota bacterium]
MPKTPRKAVRSVRERRFALAGNVLRTSGSMYWEYLGEFEDACAKLISSRWNRIEVDLMDVDFMSSVYFGPLSDMLLKAAKLNKTVVIRATPDIGWLFETIGGGKFLELDIL